jgi:hypothetical protein
VWSIPLADAGPDRTMRDVLAVAPFDERRPPNVLVRALFTTRRVLGRVFGWDDGRHENPAASYVHRLTDDDRARSLVPPGTRHGPFRLLYVFPNEAVAEIRNATVHAFLASALLPRPRGHLLYWAIYVKPVGALSAPYMAIIDPFRRWVIYPRLIAEMQRAWSAAYGLAG